MSYLYLTLYFKRCIIKTLKEAVKMLLTVKRCKECGEVIRARNEDKCESCKVHKRLYGTYKRVVAF